MFFDRRQSSYAVIRKGLHGYGYLPNNGNHSKNSRNAAEHQSHDAPRSETLRQWWRRSAFTGQIVKIFSITGRVSGCHRAADVANLQVVIGNCDAPLDVEGCLNKGSYESRVHVPFNMAVKKPDTCRKLSVRC